MPAGSTYVSLEDYVDLMNERQELSSILAQSQEQQGKMFAMLRSQSETIKKFENILDSIPGMKGVLAKIKKERQK